MSDPEQNFKAGANDVLTLARIGIWSSHMGAANQPEYISGFIRPEIV